MKKALSILVLVVILPPCMGQEAGDLDLKKLLTDYQTYELPMPPENASLVRVASIWPRQHLGFLIKNATKSEPPVILVGTRYYRPEGGQEWVSRIEPKEQEASKVKAEFRDASFPINAGLATAIQCYSRGWKKLAIRLLKKSLQESAGHHFSSYYQPQGQAPKTALAFMAWAHWGNELVEPKSDRAKIYQLMKALLKAEPKLATEKNRELLESIKVTLAPTKAKPGNVEALIDNLREVKYLWQGIGRHEFNDPTYEKLILLGFDAVPKLIDHWDDKRLTRIVRPAFMNSPPCILRVEDVVGGLLNQLSGYGIVAEDKSRVTKKDALAWWKKVQTLGEEKHLLGNVFPADTRIKWLNSIVLQVLTHKYPEHLPEIYRKLLAERPKMYSWPLAKAVGKSNLSRKKKIELLASAGRHSNLEHRRAAFWELKDLDNKRFITMLLDTLTELPTRPKEPYWSCREASFTQLVIQTSDPRAWKLLKEVAKRSDVGLRMEILNIMNYRISMNCKKQQRLDLLAEFLNDEAVPNVSENPKMFSGPRAGSSFPGLSVRNLAAMKIASILELDVNPEPKWTAKQWAELRARVRKELQDQDK